MHAFGPIAAADATGSAACPLAVADLGLLSYWLLRPWLVCGLGFPAFPSG